MTAMHRLRLYHALLAILVLFAFLSPEWGRAHLWLGYGVAAVILLRLAMIFSGAPQLGLSRFYPHFHGLKLGTAFTHPVISRVLLLAIAVTLLGVTATGIVMDQGRTFGLGPSPVADQTRSAPPETAAIRGDDDEDHGGQGRGEHEEREEGPLGEAHELLGNLLMVLVGAHVSYLLLFKRPIARFMLFAEARKPAA
ncbi:MAG: cytochrome b/b6 domain-containing protein [Caulobacter sp.]|nr:cytochrome b/b6 domain-containing protein [Caulobacter sp.]